MTKKSILYIITQSEFGGAQRYVYDLAQSLNNEFEIIVAAGPGGDAENTLLQRLEKAGLTTIHLKYLRRGINPWQDFLALRELKRIIKQTEPDIIHLNSSKASILGTLAAKNSSLKTIYTAHGWVFNEPISFIKKKLYLCLEKYTAKFKDKIICVSEFARQSGLKHGFPPDKLITIHNGIDIAGINFLPKEQARKKLIANRLSLIANHSIVGTVAHLYKTKGLEYLIEAIKFSIFNFQFSIKLIVIGEGKERPKLQKLIKKYRLQDKIFLLGHLSNAWQYLKAFDIFVLPSIKEGLPYTILEAMAAGLPIVAANVGGIPELITNNQNGLLVQPKNPALIGEKILYLINNPSVAQKMAQQARKKLEQEFTLERMLGATKTIYF